MGVTQYIGARYVPLFAEPAEWDSTRAYEPLTIVLHNGNSYTSKQAVPIGIDIDNDKFWVLSANYNAQVETYRKETAKAVDTAEASLETAKDAVSKVETEVTRATDAEKVLTDNLAAEVTRATDAEKVLTDNLATEVTRATDAEKVNADAIAAVKSDLSTEVTRSEDAEKVLTDNIIQINKTPTVYLAANRNADNKRTVDVYWTNNFTEYNKLTSFNNIFTENQDFIYLGKINDYYYIFANTEYAVSSDFVNWNTYKISISSIMPNSTIYGYKVISETSKAIACVKIGEGAASITGTTYYFQPFICDYTQSDTGVLTFSNASELVPPKYVKQSSSFIDPDVMYYNNEYNIVFKDEINQKAILYKASDISNAATWVSYSYSNNIWGYEGCKFCIVQNKICLVVSYYNFENFIKKHVSFTSGSTSWSNIVNTPAILYDVYDNPQSEYISFASGIYKNRHLGILKCDFRILSAYTFTESCDYGYPYIFVCGNQTTCNYSGPIIPNLCFTVTGATPSLTVNITSINDFKNYRNPKTNAMYLSSNSGYKPSVILSGDFIPSDFKDTNIAKTATETPTGYNLYTGKTIKLAQDLNSVDYGNLTIY